MIYEFESASLALESLEDFFKHPSMPVVDSGLIDLEHPFNLGWMLSSLFVVAESSTVSTNLVSAVTIDGSRVRRVDLEVQTDSDGRVMIGTAIASALVEFSKRGWTRRFDESISSHSILRLHLENIFDFFT